MTTDSRLHNVQLIGIPVELWHRGRLWFEGLLREFDILATDSGARTPQELLTFVAETRERFSGFGEEPQATLDRAHRTGERSVDLELALPAEAATAAEDFWVHLERAIEYCRTGELLTLTPDDQLFGFLRWYLTEISRQLRGEAPRPWNSQPPTR